MPTAINPETGEVLVLAGDEWVKPDQVAKNDAGESAYLVKNQWVLPGQNYQPPAAQGISGISGDIGKLISSAALGSAAGVPEAVQSAASGAARENTFLPTEALNLIESPQALTNKLVGAVGIPPIFNEEPKNKIVPESVIKEQKAELDKVLTQGKIQSLRDITEAGGEVAKKIENSISPEMKKAMAESQPTGNLIEALDTGDFSKISMGKDPSVLGLSGQFAKVFGSTAPIIATSLITKSAAPAAAIGFGQAASEGVSDAREYISKMSDQDLSKNSEYFRNLIILGYNSAVAKKMTEDKAADTAALYQGTVGALGGAFTGKLDKALLSSARNRATRIIQGTVVGATEEGLQELAEGLATDLGIDKTVARQLGADSFANLILGALGGGGPGGIRGAVAEGKRPAEAAPAPGVVPPIPGIPTPEAPVPPSPSQRTGEMMTELEQAVAPQAPTVAPQATAEAPVEAAAPPQPIAAPEAAPIPTAQAAPVAAAPEIAPVVPVDAPVTPLNSIKEPEVTAKPAPEMKPATFAERIKDPDVQESLKRYAQEAGWQQRGGLMIREAADDYSSPVVGRTQWLPNSDWWLTRPVSLRGDMDGSATRKAINKAYRGERLGKNEKQMVEFLIGMHDFDMTEGDRQRAELEQKDREVAEFNKQFEVPAQERAPEQAAEAPVESTTPLEDIQAEMDAKAAENYDIIEAAKARGEIDPEIQFSRDQIDYKQLAENQAKSIKTGKVEHQEGDLAVYSHYNKYGGPYYTASKGTRYSANPDLANFGDPAVNQRIREIIRQKEMDAETLHRTKPFLKFTNGLSVSENVPKGIAGVLRGWKNLLGIKANIYIATFGDVIANRDNYTGPHREINGTIGLEKANGVMKKLPNGDYFIVMKPGASRTYMLETLAHELGHVHEYEVYANAGAETQQALRTEFEKWLATNKPKTTREYLDAMRAYEASQRTRVENPQMPAYQMPSYWREFTEWYADQMARWSVSSEKPLSVVDKYFKKLADALKRFFNTIKGAGYLPNETFAQYINKSVANLEFESIAKQQQKGQMALFSKEEVPTTRLPEKMSWGIGGMHKTTPINKPSLWHDTSGYNAADLIQEDLQYPTRTTNNFFVTDNPDLALGQRGNTGVLIEYDGYNVSGKEHKKPMTGDLAGREYVADAIAKNSIKSINVKKGVKLPLKALVARDLRNKFDIVQNADGSTTMTRKEEIKPSKEEVSAPPKGPRNIENQVVSPVWNSPEVTKTDNLIYKLQDKHIDTKRVIQAIQKEVGDLDDKWNVYLQEELYHGRTSAALRKFLLQELMPVIKEMSKLGISPADMKDYLHNRHATERNDQIAKIRPDTLPDGSPNPSAMTDGGSGLTYKEIEDYFDKLDPKKAEKLEEISKKFDTMIRGTQKILVDSGIETESTINAWNKTYKHYVPLFREDDDFATHPSQGTGGGFSTSGSSGKRAMGSTKGVQDILGNILAQRERALIKKEKVRVGRALMGLAIKNPNPSFWLPVNPNAIKDFDALAAELDGMGLDGADVSGMMQEIKKPEIVTDKNTGLQTVRYKVNPLERYKDHVFPVRVNGSDWYIFFNQNDPRAKRMVESMKNLDTEQLGAILGIFGKFTRWFSAVNTQYNPVFGGINLLRDVQGAAVNLSSTKIAGEQPKVLAGVMPAMRTIFKTLKAERNGQPIPDTDDAKLWEKFKTAGGQTLYRDSLARKAEEKQLIDHELERMKRGPLRKAFSASVQLLSDFNDTIENAVRLSAYKVALEKGLSDEQAASIAKNLTVNFDRKGQLGSRINALWAFFNASMQGSARLYETMKGPAGRKIFAGGIALGAIQAVALALAGFDEDEPPEFIKERNLIIPSPLGDKKYLMIPMPLGLHFFPNIGRVTTEWAINDFKKPGKHVANLFGTAMDAFNPLGSAGLSLQTLAPTVADPLLALDANKDAFGRPIYKKDQATNPSPGYSRSREGATAVSKLLAEFLNYASGGTKYQKGAVSPTGDEIDYLVGQFTGGVGREVMKVQSAIESQITGEELAPYRVPIAGRFIGDAESKAADSQRFYENVTMLADLENEIKGRQKNREDVSGFMRDNPQARLWMVANTTENQISQLNKQRKQLLEKNAPKERIQQLENRKQEIMRRFNDRVKALEP
jgi:Large polyvalent protein associated domain 38